VSGCFVSVVSEDRESRNFGGVSVRYICPLFFCGHVVLLAVVTSEIPVPRRAAPEGSAHG